MQFLPSSFSVTPNPVYSQMTDFDDVRATLGTLLGQDFSATPVLEMVATVKARIAALEPELNDDKSFGMVELEHGMLNRLLVDLTGTSGNVSLH